MIENIWANVVAGALLLFFGYLIRLFQEKYRKRRSNRVINKFFGLDNKARVLVLHNAFFDEDRQAFNYAASDVATSRRVMNLLEIAGLVERRHFEIRPENEFKANDRELLNSNIIFVCGPKHNDLLSAFLNGGPNLEYQFVHDEQAKKYCIKNQHSNKYISSPMDNNPSDRKDIAMILSMPNPKNANRRLIVLAGIHGAGTVGVGRFITDLNNLAHLCDRIRDNGVIQEIIEISFTEEPDIIGTRLLTGVIVV